MWEVVKRTGSFTVPLPNLEPFAKEEDALAFARGFIEANPEKFQPGLRAIEVRPYRPAHR